MDFTVSVPIGHAPEAVQDAFLDPDFLERAGRLGRLDGSELLELTRGEASARLRVRYRFVAPLPRAVTAVVDPDKLTWVDDATVDLPARHAVHDLHPDHYADRLTASYRTTLAAGPGADATVWSVTGRLAVHVPLVGGRVARVIVDGLREHAVARGALVDRWLAGRT